MAKCKICDNDTCFSWTDTHGIGQCIICGAPYRIYFYENGKRVEREPECIISDEWIEFSRLYHKDTKHIIPSGCSVPGGQELAKKEDILAWNKFFEEHEHMMIKN